MKTANKQLQHLPRRASLVTALQLCLLLLACTTASISHSATTSEQIIQDNCRECHGLDGKARAESWPNLSCQNAGYLYARLLSLQRSDDHNIDEQVKHLTLTQINEISRYYAELKCSKPQ
jgi:cytochrome c553